MTKWVMGICLLVCGMVVAEEGFVAAEVNRTPAVTYTFSSGNGRFGDHLVSYMHAKWISYSYGLPLFYKEFHYSDLLAMDQLEQKFPRSFRPYRKVYVGHGAKVDKDERHSTLYVVPYFPECRQEHIEAKRKWPYFRIDWEDEGFRAELKKMIAPLEPMAPLNLPGDCMTLALHVRRGGGFDAKPVVRAHPIKFPPMSYYVEQIRTLSDLVHGKPIYAFIFTDDPNPKEIAKKLEEALGSVDVFFDYREDGNRHNLNVLEDFFAMLQFDCLIRPDSNYSIAASRIGDYKVVISPVHVKTGRGGTVIDEVNIERRGEL